jgi:multidrug resistance efflux pump
MPDVVAAEIIEEGRTRSKPCAQDWRGRRRRVMWRGSTLNAPVRAPVDGTITNVSMQPGIYLAAGKPALALVHGASLRVEGYFEETKLPIIHTGDPASIWLMGVRDEIHGHVESIAGGVEDRERSGGEAQLANVNPAFTWVRLAQRIPVRIATDKVPAGVRLIPGQTATVEIHPRADGRIVHRSLPW